jgi:hypothetical protein
MLLRWGLERAESLGVDFLTMSDTPHADLYISNGMEVIRNANDVAPFWCVGKKAVNNRERNKSEYLNTEGFW